MKVWQVRQLFGGSDITPISCFTTACLDIIKVEKCLLFFLCGIKCLTEGEGRIFVRSIVLFSALVQCRSFVMCQTETFVTSWASQSINTVQIRRMCDIIQHTFHRNTVAAQEAADTLFLDFLIVLCNIFKFSSLTCDQSYLRTTTFLQFHTKPVPR